MQHILTCNQTIAKVDELGAQLISFVCEKEYLYQADERYWNGYSPILFPNVGTLYQDKVKINNKTYTLPKHGFVKNKMFHVEEKTVNSITLSFSSTDETLAMYPFHFTLYVTHSIWATGFKTSYRVVNHSSEVMPFCIGAHPSFYCPMNKNEKFEDYELVFEQNEQAKAYYTHNYEYMDYELFWPRLNHQNTWSLSYNDFAQDSSIFEHLKSHYVSLRHKHTKKGLKLFIANFPVLVVWTMEKANAPFICVEPWQGLPAIKDETGHFEDKPHAVFLNPKETYSTFFTVDII